MSEESNVELMRLGYQEFIATGELSADRMHPEFVWDMSTFGAPSKYSYCVCENEEGNPWEPLNVERGFSRDTTTVFSSRPRRLQ